MKPFAIKLHYYNDIEPSYYSCHSVSNAASLNTKHPLSSDPQGTSWHLHFTMLSTHICSKPEGFRKSLNRSVPWCIWIQLLNQYTKCGQFKLSIFNPGKSSAKTSVFRQCTYLMENGQTMDCPPGFKPSTIASQSFGQQVKIDSAIINVS